MSTYLDGAAGPLPALGCGEEVFQKSNRFMGRVVVATCGVGGEEEAGEGDVLVLAQVAEEEAEDLHGLITSGWKPVYDAASVLLSA